MKDLTEEFWAEIRVQFNPKLDCDPPTFVLSPGQARLHQLAYLGVPKFQYIFDMAEAGHKFCLIEETLFENHLPEWHGCGLLNLDTLENKYKAQLLPPNFMPQLPAWDDLLVELADLINKQNLTSRFAQLWAAYIRKAHLMAFISLLDPYRTANRSAEENESSEVERYIYALWMHHHGYSKKKGEKSKLMTDLAFKLDEALNNLKTKGNRPWRFAHYDALLLTKDEKNPILRTVTDMNLEMITEYATDGAFTLKDFPELFSVT